MCIKNFMLYSEYKKIYKRVQDPCIRPRYDL